MKTEQSPRLIKIGSVFSLFVGVLLVLSLIRNVGTILSADKRIQQTQVRFEKTQKENEALKNELEALGSNFYKEKQARDQLGLSKEGEAVVILPDEELLRRLSPIVQSNEVDELPDPVWMRWKKLFF